MVVHSMNANGMTAGMQNSAAFSAGNLPESFDQYRPPAQFSADDTTKIPPPSFKDARQMPSYATEKPSRPDQTKLTGMPLPADKKFKGTAAYEPPPLPNSMTEQSRTKDPILSILLESQSGADQIASFNVPVIKERPSGLEPRMVQNQKAEPRGELDMGTYEGTLEGGVRSGPGACIYRNGNKYEGDWLNNKRHGRGTMNYHSGASYDGEWLQGERSGHGVMKYSDGSQYEGQWLRDLKHGYGSYKFASGAKYIGQWFEGKMHGQGTYTYADGQRFQGEFERNAKNGFGTHAYLNGDVWDGVWVADIPHGPGLYLSSTTGNKVRSTFIKQGEPLPDGRGLPSAEMLRKEDKLRIMKEAEDAARKAQIKAEGAAQISADARKTMHKVLDDTTTLLGLIEPIRGQ